MLDYTLSSEQLDELRAAHRGTQDKREADRIKAVVALVTGWTAEEVAEILQVDANTVRNHFKRYRADGLAGLNRVGDGVGGSPCLLTEEQLIGWISICKRTCTSQPRRSPIGWRKLLACPTPGVG